jgi:uncharacterized protein (TIGR00255 family)
MDRAREGEVMHAHVAGLLNMLMEGVARVADAEADANARYEERLRQRMVALLGEHPVDEGRLLQEVALMAERRDVTEERVRLSGHIEGCARLLGAEGAVGRELGFLAQELLREVNTIGSKAQDLVLTEQVVALKSCIEQMREQILNLE